MNLDLDKLEQVARAATPGPWERGGESGGCEFHVYGEDFAGAAICGMNSEFNFTSHERRIQNLDFIAAANPAVVLELVRRLRAAEADAKRLDWVMANRNLRVQGNDKTGWCVLDCRNGLTFLVQHADTARIAIDAAKATRSQP